MDHFQNRRPSNNKFRGGRVGKSLGAQALVAAGDRSAKVKTGIAACLLHLRFLSFVALEVCKGVSRTGQTSCLLVCFQNKRVPFKVDGLYYSANVLAGGAPAPFVLPPL